MLTRDANPIGYWIATSLLILTALLGVGATAFVVYSAATGSGIYAVGAFFSWRDEWPFGVPALGFGWLAVRMVRNWRAVRRQGRAHAA